MLRQSERSTFKRCPQRWWWGYRQGLVPNTPDRGGRWFGTGLHLCFAGYYLPGTKRGIPLAETWDAYTKDSFATVQVEGLTEEAEAEYVDARALGFSLIDRYEKKYQGDPHWHVIMPEQRFQVYIPDPSNPSKAIAINVGTFDLVYRDLNDGHIKLVDHKAVKQVKDRHLTIDDQNGSYIAFATHSLRQQKVIGEKEFVKGMEYNFIKKQKADQRPENELGQKLNKNGSVSKRQPRDPLQRIFVPRNAHERNEQIKRVGAEVLWMNAVRKGTLPLIKTPTDSCPWDCDFFDLCEVHEAGGDWQGFIDAAFHVQDPYADHREGAQNSKLSVESDRKLRES